MKIATLGLWHLGTVTTAGLAKEGFEVTAYDRNEETLSLLREQRLPVAEPGLADLLFSLPVHYSLSPEDLSAVEMIWVTYDTPVDDEDRADVSFVQNEIKTILPFLNVGTLILISSQLPVGSTAELQRYCRDNYPQKEISFAYSPENLRLGKAIEIFTKPERIVVGVQNDHDKERLAAVLSKFSNHIIWMSLESAEMTKHALNAFLATSVVFANELATLCEKVGADAREVEKGLKSEMRIGPYAYLKAGNAFAGGTLARDVIFLQQISQQYDRSLPLFNALLESNNLHKQWVVSHLSELFESLHGKKIALLGLTYKPGTNTLRRSSAVELAQRLHTLGASVIAYDPAINELPEELNFIHFQSSISAALKDSDAAVIATEWPDFSSLKADDIVRFQANPVVIDANGYLALELANDHRIRYFRVGKAA